MGDDGSFPRPWLPSGDAVEEDSLDADTSEMCKLWIMLLPNLEIILSLDVLFSTKFLYRTITGISDFGAISRSWSGRDMSNWESSLTWKNQLITSSSQKGTLRSKLSPSSRSSWWFERPSSSESWGSSTFTRSMSLGVGASCFCLLS